MKTTNQLLAALSALVLPGVALADNPAWTYGQVGYVRADSGDDSTDAFRVKGSLAFLEQFHVQAEWFDGEYGDSEASFDGEDNVDFDGYRLVVGAHPSLAPNTDGVLQLQYFDIEADGDGSGYYGNTDVEIDGFGVGAGLRHMLTDKVELGAVAWWNEAEWDADGDDEDFSDISIEFAGRYAFTENLSAGVAVVTNDPLTDHGDSMTIDLRWQFNDLF